MVLRVFFISTTGRRDIRYGQIHVFSVLSSWKYAYQAIDVAAPENANERNFVIESGKKAEDGKIILPQIFTEEECCGDYLDFLNAIEHEKLQLFLKQITQDDFNLFKQIRIDRRENETTHDGIIEGMQIEPILSRQDWNEKEEMITDANKEKEDI